MDHELSEQIFSFGKSIGKSCKIDELMKMFDMTEEEWLQNNEDQERGLDYRTWNKVICAIITMKNEGLCYINEKEFFRVFNIT